MRILTSLPPCHHSAVFLITAILGRCKVASQYGFDFHLSDGSWYSVGLPGGTSGKEFSYQCRRCQRHGFDSWVGKIPWRRKWHPTPVFLPGESHGQRSLADCCPWGHRESDTTEHLSMMILSIFLFSLFDTIVNRIILFISLSNG